MPRKHIYQKNKAHYQQENRKASKLFRHTKRNTDPAWWEKEVQRLQTLPIAVRKMKIRWEVLKRDNFTCQYCGRKAPDVVLHVDHKIPKSLGGTYSMENLITACFACNIGKSNRL